MLSSEPDTIHYNENVHKALKDDKIKKKKLYHLCIPYLYDIKNIETKFMIEYLVSLIDAVCSILTMVLVMT